MDVEFKVFCIDLVLPAAVNENAKRRLIIDHHSMSPGSAPVSFSGVSIRPLQYSLVFYGLATDDYYDNFFQSGNRNSVQIELQHPGQLYLKIGDSFAFKVSNNIELNRWYKYEVNGAKGNFVRFFIDNTLVFETAKPEIVSQELDFNDIKFGTGYGDQRRLQGELKALEFEVSGISSPAWLRPVLCVFGIGCALTWIVFFLNTSKGVRFVADFRSSIQMNGLQSDLLALFLLLSGSSIWLTATGALESKWVVLAVMGFAIGASPFLRSERLAQLSYVRIPLLIIGLSGVVFLGYVLWKNPRIDDRARDVHVAMATIFLVVPLVILFSKSKNNYLGSLEVIIRKIFFLALLIVSSLTLADLQNWQLYSSFLVDQPATGTFLALVGAGLAFYIPFAVRENANDDSTSK